MNKKVLFYALGINLVTSFLGALAFPKCGPGQINCGPFNVYIPIVVSGSVFIPIAYFIAKLLKRPVVFFVVIAFLGLMLNSSPDSIDPQIIFACTFPVLLAALVAWYLGREKVSVPQS